MAGKPVVEGTRRAVDYVLNRLGPGATEEGILQEYEGLKRADIRACLVFGARSLSEASFVPPEAAAENLHICEFTCKDVA